MKPLDDMLPEETSKEYEPLLALLSHAPRKLAPLTSEEQEQAIARVQARLTLTESSVPHNEDIVEQQVAPVHLHPQRTRAVSPRRKRVLRFVNTLAAILVIGAIIGISLLLFRRQPQTIGSNLSQGYQPGTIYANIGGLEATLRVVPGPYFLSELLPVDITLTNHSHTTYQLEGFPVANPCDQALGSITPRLVQIPLIMPFL